MGMLNVLMTHDCVACRRAQHEDRQSERRPEARGSDGEPCACLNAPMKP